MLFPVRRWGAQRDALADALAGVADYARRLRDDPVAPFDPVPLMTARNAAAVTPRQARRRPADLHGARGVAERLRPVLASLADPALGVPPRAPNATGPGRSSAPPDHCSTPPPGRCATATRCSWTRRRSPY